MYPKKWMFVLLALITLTSGYLYMQPDNPVAGKITLQGLNFHTDLQPALLEASSQGKPVFVYFRSEYCGWCKKFEEETFTNRSVARTLNENFILVSIDVNKQKNETRDFRVRGTPAEVFLDPKGTEIKRIPGYTETEVFLDTINQIAKYKEA
ncbi:Thiol:disulfide interchange protein DsbD [uncultured archaeon]|nr:Thiol:disulfide interchange protein DsbD [uncultured archaeon]